MRRTFTLLEFARITQLLGSAETCLSLADFVRVCTPLRRLANARSNAMDIADPYGGPPAGYVHSFDLIAEAVEQTATAISRHVTAVPDRAADEEPASCASVCRTTPSCMRS